MKIVGGSAAKQIKIRHSDIVDVRVYNTLVSNPVVSVISNDKDFEITTTPAQSYLRDELAFKCASDYVVELPENGKISRDGDRFFFNQTGVETIKVKTKGSVKEFALSGSITAPSSSLSYVSGLRDGYLKKSLHTFLPEIFSGYKEASAENLNLKPFVEESYLVGLLTPNPSNLISAHGIDTSCIVYGSGTSNGVEGTRSGCVVSPSHVISAWHWRPLNYIKVIDENGVVHTRQVSAWRHILKPNGSPTDIAVGWFADPLPATIKPARVLPKNRGEFASILSPNDVVSPILIYLHTIKRFVVFYGRSGAASVFYTNIEPSTSFSNSEIKPYRNLSIVNGGSSSPCFFVLNNELVLDGTLWMGYYSWTPVSDYIPEIDAAMAELHGSATYALSQVSLSEYPLL